MKTKATETLDTIRAFYAAAVRGPGPERETVRTGDWYTRVLSLHSAGESREKIEAAQRAFQTLQSVWTVEAMRAEIAAMRAAWETGDRVAFYATVKAARQLNAGHGPNRMNDLWARAMTLAYQDAADWRLAEIERYIPCDLDTAERDAERYAEDRGLQVQIENKALHLYYAREAARFIAVAA